MTKIPNITFQIANIKEIDPDLDHFNFITSLTIYFPNGKKGALFAIKKMLVQ